MRLRRQAGALVVVAAALAAAVAPSAPAGSLDECAQRVIRDWYTGGRVDDVYPLACYRAALRALPADVLQYSNADQDIRRALAYARRGRSDPGNATEPEPTERKATPPPAAEEARPADAAAAPKRAAARPKPAPVANEAAAPTRSAPVASEAAAPTRSAPVAAERSSSASVPYPILVLTALAAVLLTTGAAGWLLDRRR